jgi:cytoskeletal protein CcmA (bactofilin family)
MGLKKERLSIIDKNLDVKGTLQFTGKIVVAGTLHGNVYGEHALTLQGSHVHADVKIDEMTIGGSFEGDIIAYKRLKILHTGNVTGNLFCNTLIIEPGGILNGRVERLAPKGVVTPLETKKQTDPASHLAHNNS